MSEEKDAKIQELEAEIARLKDENSKLQETVQWMHDLIWKMVREREGQKRRSVRWYIRLSRCP